MTSDKIELLAKFHYEEERDCKKGWAGLNKKAQEIRIKRMSRVLKRLERHSD